MIDVRNDGDVSNGAVVWILNDLHELLLLLLSCCIRLGAEVHFGNIFKRKRERGFE